MTKDNATRFFRYTLMFTSLLDFKAQHATVHIRSLPLTRTVRLQAGAFSFKFCKLNNNKVG